jgi:putative FmdB family regulatory protein
MPIYEYQCANCGHQLEELQSITEPPLLKCPKCGKDTLKKLIGSGGGLIFKGSGFYLTDYKKKSSSGSSSHTKKEKSAKESKKKDGK